MNQEPQDVSSESSQICASLAWAAALGAGLGPVDQGSQASHRLHLRPKRVVPDGTISSREAPRLGLPKPKTADGVEQLPTFSRNFRECQRSRAIESNDFHRLEGTRSKQPCERASSWSQPRIPQRRTQRRARAGLSAAPADSICEWVVGAST